MHDLDLGETGVFSNESSFNATGVDATDDGREVASGKLEIHFFKIQERWQKTDHLKFEGHLPTDPPPTPQEK